MSFLHHQSSTIQLYQTRIQDNVLSMDFWNYPPYQFLSTTQQDLSYQVKKQNVDVILIDTYGINQEVARALFQLLPDYELILPQLLSTINITKGNLQHSLSNLYDLQLKMTDQLNPFTLKGKGMVCCQGEGFATNEFICFYFGEVYSPQRWFEKQTIFNKRMQDGNRKTCSQSPYVEFFINDDLLVMFKKYFQFIDPTRYGNMAQHISYSCDPNCRLVTVIVNQQNLLAVMTAKKINYLEELTLPFPLTCMDQCLCGSLHCKRVQHLEMENAHQSSIYPNYIQRNVILLQSTLMSCQNTQSDIPEWLANWQKLNHQQNYINIFSCVDKVKFALQHLKTVQPPIFLVTNIFDQFWKNYGSNTQKIQLESSIINEIVIFLKRHSQQHQCSIGLEIIKQMKQIIDQNSIYALELTRMLFLLLSEIILNIESCSFNNKAFATILYFMSFTHTYFSSTQYQGFDSKPFEENEFEYIPQPKNKSKLALSKQYTPQFIWGQLINWNKQTLQNPQSSMAQERRGVLCYPSLLLSFDNKHKTFPYQCKTREIYLEYFQSKKEIQPDLSTWSYKNQHNIYGTIFFEQYFSQQIVGEDFVSQICKLGMQSFETKFQYWLHIENCFNMKQEMIDELQTIFQEKFQTFFDQTPKSNSCTEYVNIIKKKVKFNQDTIIAEETQFSAY
ncbi:unnamed protein product (macronuclear) [Paramecium tetraurelia]|uniref:SET domain-containing protein n=1 Tax=Paramecium tetraurelia TaxID=5888 RepID=A0EBG7_PARTE|nr:uncharacterized protein GSPATT00025368001 [Paramecium tetraurelia]CAK92634.1 unnamed protein product [Paramecium tetraurelia]|eukprot:XP_001460031.1 hypothetical protein (macronuclear) [Paramecium tetraurelia strain d4-2]